MQIKINNKKYEVTEGEIILDILNKENIRIPTLCSYGKLKKEAACRLCLVEVKGSNRLTTSCTLEAQAGMEIITESEKIRKARSINLELLWSDHAGKCSHCKKNRQCELQNLAEEYKIENFHFIPRKGEITSQEELDLIRDDWSRIVVDDKNPVIARTTEFCIECRRCLNICPGKMIGFNYRAGDVVIGTPYEKTLDCLFCGACVKHCPTGAATDKNNLEEIQKKLDDINILAVAIVDPAILKSINNEVVEIKEEKKLNGFLKELGFEKIFSLNYGMEKYLQQITEELQNKKDKSMIINSSCVAVNRLVEKRYPELKKQLAKVDIPDEIMAKVIKTDYAKKNKINPKNIFIVAISSCTAKKSQSYKNLDNIITVRELGRMVRERKIKGSSVKELARDEIEEKDFSSAEKIIKTGELTKLVLKKIKNKKLKTVVTDSVQKTKEILDDIRKRKEEYDFIEAMICPGGCLNGGGQARKIEKVKTNK